MDKDETETMIREDEEQVETNVRCKLLKKIEEKIDNVKNTDELEQLIRLFAYLK